MKVINNYFNIQCGTCGTGLLGEQHWFEAPCIIVHCQNQNCAEHGNKYKLPIQRIELEPYVEPVEYELISGLQAEKLGINTAELKQPYANQDSYLINKE